MSSKTQPTSPTAPHSDTLVSPPGEGFQQPITAIASTGTSNDLLLHPEQLSLQTSIPASDGGPGVLQQQQQEALQGSLLHPSLHLSYSANPSPIPDVQSSGTGRLVMNDRHRHTQSAVFPEDDDTLFPQSSTFDAPYSHPIELDHPTLTTAHSEHSNSSRHYDNTLAVHSNHAESFDGIFPDEQDEPVPFHKQQQQYEHHNTDHFTPSHHHLSSQPHYLQQHQQQQQHHQTPKISLNVPPLTTDHDYTTDHPAPQPPATQPVYPQGQMSSPPFDFSHHAKAAAHRDDGEHNSHLPHDYASLDPATQRLHDEVNRLKQQLQLITGQTHTDALGQPQFRHSHPHHHHDNQNHQNRQYHLISTLPPRLDYETQHNNNNAYEHGYEPPYSQDYSHGYTEQQHTNDHQHRAEHHPNLHGTPFVASTTTPTPRIRQGGGRQHSTAFDFPAPSLERASSNSTAQSYAPTSYSAGEFSQGPSTASSLKGDTFPILVRNLFHRLAYNPSQDQHAIEAATNATMDAARRPLDYDGGHVTVDSHRPYRMPTTTAAPRSYNLSRNASRHSVESTNAPLSHQEQHYFQRGQGVGGGGGGGAMSTAGNDHIQGGPLSTRQSDTTMYTAGSVVMREPCVKKSDLLAYFIEQGILLDDPRVADTIHQVVYGEPFINQQRFQHLLSNDFVLRKVVQQQFIVGDFPQFTNILRQLFAAVLPDTSGGVATYIPQLASVNPDQFGLGVCTIDGQRFNYGHSEVAFCIQSCSKPITYCAILQEHGVRHVHKHIGREPSGRGFNERILNPENLPHNPMINSGAIMSVSLFNLGKTEDQRFDAMINIWQRLSGSKHVTFNNSTYLSERATAARNFSLAYMMKEAGTFHPGTNLVETLELYFMQCSIELTCSLMSIVAATLANGGRNPLTNEVIFEPWSVRYMLSLLFSSGMYNASGEFAFTVGCPCKSGVSGVVMMIIPGKLGVATWSPNLDRLGNSVRGVSFCKLLMKTFDLHLYSNLQFRPPTPFLFEQIRRLHALVAHRRCVTDQKSGDGDDDHHTEDAYNGSIYYRLDLRRNEDAISQSSGNSNALNHGAGLLSPRLTTHTHHKGYNGSRQSFHRDLLYANPNQGQLIAVQDENEPALHTTIPPPTIAFIQHSLIVSMFTNDLTLYSQAISLLSSLDTSQPLLSTSIDSLDLIRSVLDTVTYDGLRLIEIAATMGHIELVAALIIGGADTMQVNHKRVMRMGLFQQDGSIDPVNLKSSIICQGDKCSIVQPSANNPGTDAASMRGGQQQPISTTLQSPTKILRQSSATSRQSQDSIDTQTTFESKDDSVDSVMSEGSTQSAHKGTPTTATHVPSPTAMKSKTPLIPNTFTSRTLHLVSHCLYHRRLLCCELIKLSQIHSNPHGFRVLFGDVISMNRESKRFWDAVRPATQYGHENGTGKSSQNHSSKHQDTSRSGIVGESSLGQNLQKLSIPEESDPSVLSSENSLTQSLSALEISQSSEHHQDNDQDESVFHTEVPAQDVMSCMSPTEDRRYLSADTGDFDSQDGTPLDDYQTKPDADYPLDDYDQPMDVPVIELYGDDAAAVHDDGSQPHSEPDHHHHQNHHKAVSFTTNIVDAMKKIDSSPQDMSRGATSKPPTPRGEPPVFHQRNLSVSNGIASSSRNPESVMATTVRTASNIPLQTVHGLRLKASAAPQDSRQRGTGMGKEGTAHTPSPPHSYSAHHHLRPITGTLVRPASYRSKLSLKELASDSFVSTEDTSALISYVNSLDGQFYTLASHSSTAAATGGSSRGVAGSMKSQGAAATSMSGGDTTKQPHYYNTNKKPPAWLFSLVAAFDSEGLFSIDAMRLLRRAYSLGYDTRICHKIIEAIDHFVVKETPGISSYGKSTFCVSPPSRGKHSCRCNAFVQIHNDQQFSHLLKDQPYLQQHPNHRCEGCTGLINNRSDSISALDQPFTTPTNDAEGGTPTNTNINTNVNGNTNTKPNDDATTQGSPSPIDPVFHEIQSLALYLFPFHHYYRIVPPPKRHAVRTIASATALTPAMFYSTRHKSKQGKKVGPGGTRASSIAPALQRQSSIDEHNAIFKPSTGLTPISPDSANTTPGSLTSPTESLGDSAVPTNSTSSPQQLTSNTVMARISFPSFARLLVNCPILYIICTNMVAIPNWSSFCRTIQTIADTIAREEEKALRILQNSGTGRIVGAVDDILEPILTDDGKNFIDSNNHDYDEDGDDAGEENFLHTNRHTLQINPSSLRGLLKSRSYLHHGRRPVSSDSSSSSATMASISSSSSSVLSSLASASPPSLMGEPTFIQPLHLERFTSSASVLPFESGQSISPPSSAAAHPALPPQTPFRTAQPFSNYQSPPSFSLDPSNPGARSKPSSILPSLTQPQRYDYEGCSALLLQSDSVEPEQPRSVEHGSSTRASTQHGEHDDAASVSGKPATRHRISSTMGVGNQSKKPTVSTAAANAAAALASQTMLGYATTPDQSGLTQSIHRSKSSLLRQLGTNTGDEVHDILFKQSQYNSPHHDHHLQPIASTNTTGGDSPLQPNQFLYNTPLKQKLTNDQLVASQSLGITPTFGRTPLNNNSILFHQESSDDEDLSSIESDFRLSICTVTAQQTSYSDDNKAFCVQSLFKVINYCIVQELYGENIVHQYVGKEPSGREMNELCLDHDNRPHNPYINAGAIMCCALLMLPEMSMSQRFDLILQYWTSLCGGAEVTYNIPQYLYEKENADRNYCLSFMIKDQQSFPSCIRTHKDVDVLLDLYALCSSIQLTTKQIAIASATLANGGINPITGQLVFQPKYVRNALSIMSTCGLYNFSGEFSFHIGLPAKSSGDGALMICVPGLFGMCINSKIIDDNGISTMACRFIFRMSKFYALHVYEHSDTKGKCNPRLARQNYAKRVVQLLCAAKNNDLFTVQRLITQGVNVNACDGFGRTALHIAVQNGAVGVVSILLNSGADLNARDISMNTPETQMYDNTLPFYDALHQKFHSDNTSHLGSENDDGMNDKDTGSQQQSSRHDHHSDNHRDEKTSSYQYPDHQSTSPLSQQNVDGDIQVQQVADHLGDAFHDLQVMRQHPNAEALPGSTSHTSLIPPSIQASNTTMSGAGGGDVSHHAQPMDSHGATYAAYSHHDHSLTDHHGTDDGYVTVDNSHHHDHDHDHLRQSAHPLQGHHHTEGMGQQAHHHSTPLHHYSQQHDTEKSHFRHQPPAVSSLKTPRENSIHSYNPDYDGLVKRVEECLDLVRQVKDSPTSTS